MKFEWDEAKRLTNIKRHGIDFEEVENVFADITVTILDDRFDYEELRWLTFGVLGGAVVVIAHTETDEVVRVISARKVSKYEEETYFKEIKN